MVCAKEKELDSEKNEEVGAEEKERMMRKGKTMMRKRRVW